jgi:hypothetical protein
MVKRTLLKETQDLPHVTATGTQISQTLRSNKKTLLHTSIRC